MHNKHAVNSWLVWLVVLLPWGTMAADPPPPLVRSVLSTNVAPFGTTGQTLFRTTASPYLNWSNTVNADGVTNLVQSKSNFIVTAHGTLNVSNDAVFGTNKMLITTNGDVWKKGKIVSDFGLAVGTNTAAMWGYWPDEATTSSAFESFRDTDKEYPFNELALGLKSGLGSGLFCGFGTEMNQNGAGFFLQATTNINTSSYFWVDLNNGSNATYQTKFYMKHLGTNLFWMGEGGDWTNRGFHVSRDIISSNSLTVKGEQTNSGGIHFTNVTMPGGGDSGVMMVNQTNATITNGAGFFQVRSNGDYYGNGVQWVKANSAMRSTAAGNSYYLDLGHAKFRDADGGIGRLYSDAVSVGDGYNASTASKQLIVQGNTGLGTNSPQSREHVTADNSVPYIAQWGTTNRPQLMTLDTNGGLNILPAASAITNAFQIVGTNGIGLGHDVVVESMGRVGVGTNMPQARFHLTGTNGPNQYLLQVENPMYAGVTNGLGLRTNGTLELAGNSSASTVYMSNSSGSLRFGSYGVAAIAGFTPFSSSVYFDCFNGSEMNFRANGAIIGLHIATTETDVPLNFGAGTNAPQSRLHVTADNSKANAVTIDTTNRNGANGLATITTNGVLSVNPGGGLNPVGCYGALMMNATNIVICAGAASVYTNVSGTGYTTIVTNGFYGDITGNSAALTNLYGGWYRGAISLSALGANNQAIEAELFTNGVACDLISFKKTYDAAARMDTMAASGIIYLPAGCRTDFRVQDAGTGGSIAIHRASIVIGTP